MNKQLRKLYKNVDLIDFPLSYKQTEKINRKDYLNNNIDKAKTNS